MIARAAIALIVCVAMQGCVTETVRPDGTVSKAKPKAGEPFDKPLATPALDARTLNTRVTVALTPLGSIAYDAQVLPMVSPDGRFVAVQQGRAPDWPTVLAAPDAGVPIRTTIAVYDITGSAPRRIDPVEPLPPGLLLGRSGDQRSFLIESPQPDGSRWIGRVHWRDGRLEWLVQNGDVNAQATLSPDGTLLYARRTIDNPVFSLIVGGVPLDTGASLSYPLATSESDLIYALEHSDIGLSVVAVRRRSGSSTVIARRRLASSDDPVVAYQVATASFVVPADAPGAPDRLALLLPRARRMAVFDPVAATFAPLPDKSIAAAFITVDGQDGFFSTTPEGLVYTPRPEPADLWDQPDEARPPAMAKVLASPFVPRTTSDVERPVILLGPDPTRPDRLRLFALKPIT